MGDIRVMKLETEDLEIFKSLRLESLRMEPAAFANTFTDWSSLTEDEWLNRMKLPVFAILGGAVPLGLMGLMLQPGEKRSHRATIIMVYLHECERGSGVANVLL